jgi:hypothetical protein
LNEQQQTVATSSKFSWRQFLHEVENLKWYDALIAFLFRFMAKTSEPLLAVGIIVSAIDFLQKGQLLASHPQLAFAWSCAQGIAMEVSVGPVLVSALDANEDGDLWKARLYGALSVLLGVVGGAMLLLQFIASILGLAETQITPFVLYPLFLFRTVASVGYIALSCTKHKRFSGRLSVRSSEVPQLLEMVEQMEEREQRSTEIVQSFMGTLQQRMSQVERRYEQLSVQIGEVLQMVTLVSQQAKTPLDVSSVGQQVQASEQRVADRLSDFQASVQAMIERQNQQLPRQIDKQLERILSELRSSATETPTEIPAASKPSVPLREDASLGEFDKGQFVRGCLTENPQMTIGDIQRKAQEVGQSIASSYISDIRKAFRSESQSKATNGNGNGHTHPDLKDLAIVAKAE